MLTDSAQADDDDQCYGDRSSPKAEEHLMPRWPVSLSEGEWRAIDELSSKLRELAPERWSIVKGKDGLNIRPRNRRLGKFSLTPSSNGRYYVSFYSPKKGHWTHSHYFDINDDLARDIMDWMVSILDE